MPAAAGGLQIEIRKGSRIEPLRGGAMGCIERDCIQLIGACLADGGEDVGVGRIDRLLEGREERAALLGW